ncbi:hypothetical protein ACJD0Z_16030 [Flavobacteriaceae bacterium M23B6Z8]
MSYIFIKHIKCISTNDTLGDDHIKLKIIPDLGSEQTLENENIGEGDTWTIDSAIFFLETIKFQLTEIDTFSSDDELGSHTLRGNFSMQNGTILFNQEDAHYELIFNLSVRISPEAEERSPANINKISLRKFFSQMGQGAILNNSYETYIKKPRLRMLSNEVISVRDQLKLHARQDGDKSNTNSIKKWVSSHCNFRDNNTINNDNPEGRWSPDTFTTGRNWTPVTNEKSYMLAGFQDYSRVTHTDNPTSHETRDWTFDIFPDPTFMYLLGDNYKRKSNGERAIPLIHNEWESGSFPLEWRPFWGEYVSIWGRLIWDVGHSPVSTEIHPAHTIIKEKTTAAGIGTQNKIIAVNQATIGMGLSGGFPGNVGDRWEKEFREIPEGVWGDTKDCWATNLKKHPVKFKFFPPTERKNATDKLKYRIRYCKHIVVENGDALDDFLELTQNDDPSKGGEDRGFRKWNNTPGFSKTNTPEPLKPKFKQINGIDGKPAYYEVSIDLSNMNDIPVGYYAIIECGWDSSSDREIKKYELTFKSIKAIKTDFWTNEWHLYYGVNGSWNAWWSGDDVDQGDIHASNKKITFYTLDNLPIAIRDTGVKWNGSDFNNEKLDAINLLLEGPDHLADLRTKATNSRRIQIVKDQSNMIEFKLKSKEKVKDEEDAELLHEWTLKLELK